MIGGAESFYNLDIVDDLVSCKLNSLCAAGRGNQVYTNRSFRARYRIPFAHCFAQGCFDHLSIGFKGNRQNLNRDSTLEKQMQQPFWFHHEGLCQIVHKVFVCSISASCPEAAARSAIRSTGMEIIPALRPTGSS